MKKKIMKSNYFLVVNKEVGYTSRDVVNIVSKIIGTKKIGHTGTLDPLAKGVLVLCVNKYTSLSELVTSYDKEYAASMVLGIETDTLDITGNEVKRKDISLISDEQIKNAFAYFNEKTYLQEVPLYSAVKINGHRLYEYARNNIKVDLPKREVTIYNIEILDISRINENIIIKFKTKVSKGTYIRSLIRDIAYYLDNYAVMSELTRTKQGVFDIKDSYTIDDIKSGNYATLKLEDVTSINKIPVLEEKLLKKISNGAILENLDYPFNLVLFVNSNNEDIAIYKKSDVNKWTLYKML